MTARLSTGQDRYTIWQGLVGNQTAEEFWTESQAQGATTYREAAEAYIEHLRETQGLVSEVGWTEEDVPVLVDMLVEVMEEDLGTEAPDLTPDDKRQLGRLTTHDEAGVHFTERYSDGWLQRMERAGYITINRPVHEATGIPYGREHWTVEVSPEVGEWFDEYGELIED